MVHTFETEQWIGREPEQMFLFFADPNNLPRLMPRWQRARIERAHLVPPGEILQPDAGRLAARPLAGPGSTMTISFRPVPFSPVRMTWDAVIRDFAWGSHFCDEQERGPFQSWRHCHSVRGEERNGVAGSVVKDALTYSLPFGPLGELAHTLAVRRQLEGLFRYRQRRLAEIFPPAQV